MANIAYNQLLSLPQVTRVVSTIKTPGSVFQQWLGFMPGGRNVTNIRGNMFAFDQFNKTRKIATHRPSGTGPATVTPQTIGQTPIKLSRAHEKIHLLQDKVFNTRPIGGNYGDVDVNGQSYVTKQEDFIAQRFRNNRELLTAFMLRGSIQLKVSGDEYVPVASGGQVTISFGTLLDATSYFNGGTIATISTDLISAFLALNAGMEQGAGWPLRHVWINSTVFGYLNKNTGFLNAGGSANTVWQTYTTSPYSSAEGVPDSGFVASFKCLPWLQFHVYDAGLDIDGTFTKFIPDDHIIATPEPSNDWTEMVEGSEMIAENVMDMSGREVTGIAAWTERTTQPAGWDLIAVDNALPVLYKPNAIAYIAV